jgi:CheY-like chemotaxis protein
VSSRTILVVDDEDDIREVVQMSLELGAGWTVLTASSGEEGVAKATSERCDAILLDVMMPGIDGPETLARLRSDPRTAELPVIFLTAKAQSAEQQRLAALGANAVMSKPFDPLSVAREIADALGWVEV